MTAATDPSSNSLLSSRRVLKEDGKKVNDAAQPMSIFPHNVGGLLPRTYYSQFKDWYSHMVIPEALWSDSSKQWLMNFSFVNHITTTKEKSSESSGNNNVNHNQDFRANQRGDNGHSNDNSSCVTSCSNNYRTSCSNDNRNEHSSFSYESNRCHEFDRCQWRAPRYDSQSRSRSYSLSHDRSKETSSNRHRHGFDGRNARRSRVTRSCSPSPRHDESSSKRRRIMFGNWNVCLGKMNYVIARKVEHRGDLVLSLDEIIWL